MKFTPEVIAAIETLRKNAENDFELHRIRVLEKDLTAPPAVEIIDDTHQKFNGFIFHKKKDEHFGIGISIQRVIWQYFNGEIPTGEYEVHHLNLNPADNKPSNLQLLTRSEHQKIHSHLTEPQLCTCEVCGKSFFVQNRRRKLSRYCSKSCRNYARDVNEKYKVKKVCVVCGKEFVTDKYKNAVCCSINCRAKLIAEKKKNAPRKYSEIQCPVCGKTFAPKNSKTIFCSRACRDKSKSKKDKKQCPICGKNFLSNPSAGQIYCSRSCAYSARKSNNKQPS